MKLKIAIVAVIAASAGFIIWAVIQLNAWQEACNDAGGHVQTEYAGQITTPIYDDKGRVVGYNSQPQYTYHCMINGQEVEVG